MSSVHYPNLGGTTAFALVPSLGRAFFAFVVLYCSFQMRWPLALRSMGGWQ